MIPKNAIKKVKNDIHLEIAAGSLIAYGVFPQTAEGIRRAKETAASKDTWLAPSDLPEYYANIDDDLLKGRENDAIRAIRRTLKEFYGISSAGTEGFVDTSSSRPAVPAGIQITWFSVTQVGPTTWEKLKAQLTGKGYFSEVNLSEKDADELISNIRKSGEFPSLKDQSGIHNEVYQNWLVDTYLPNYGKTQVYNPDDKFVDDGKEFADKIVTDLDDALEEKSNEIMDDIDAILEADKKKYEDFKKQLNRKVDHPELYEELQHIQPRYMWGQNGLYDLEFKSDIDRAIYFAGKITSKDTPDKVAVRAWLLEVTGLDVRENYSEIKEYRNRILALILQLVKLHPNERDVIVPPVYDGYYQDPPDEEEGEEVDDEEEMDDEEYDDLYGSNLDDLLEVVRSPKSPEEETDQELNEQIDDATQVLDEAEEAQQEAIDESVLEDLPEDLQQTLIDFINKRRNQKQDKEKTSSSNISNRKIYNFLTTNLIKIQDQLEGINQGIQNQNTLMAANVSATFAIIDKLESQDNIIAAKLDSLTEAINGQSQLAKLQQDKQEDILAEQRAESQRDAAGTEGFTDYSGKGGGLFGKLLKFFGKKLARFIWRLLPRRLRAAARLGRMTAKRLGSKILQRSAAKASTKIATKVPTTAIAKGFEHIALPGVTRAVAPATDKITKGAGQNVLQRALKSKAIQQALVKKLGSEGAQKLSVKLAAKLVPGVATAYGLGEGIARIAMGDVKGGFLSFGSAIPVAGWGFAAIDILRDIDTNAYTKHIEPNLPSPSGENFGAFFNDALGVSSNQYETGGVTKKGIATLHGTEAVVPKDNFQSVDPIGGIILAATSQYINKVGPAASKVAPAFEQVAAPLAKVYGVPNTLVQTNVGGSFPSMENSFKRISSFGKGRKEEELTGAEKDLIDTKDDDSFAEKLAKLIDPDEKFKKLLENLNRPRPGDDDNPIPLSEGGYATFGETGSGSNAEGWVHGHFQNSNSAAELLRDTFPFVRKLLDQGSEVVITGGVDRPLNKNMDDAEVKSMISKGIETHSNRTKGYFAVDVSVRKGTKVPFALQDVRDTGGNEGVSGMIPGTNTFIGHLTADSKSGGPAPSSSTKPPTASGSYDVIIPLDHVKPGNQTKIPDKKGGNTFKNASATGADGREREHQDKAAAKIKAKLEKKGLRVKIITPEDFGNYEDYDKYIMAQSAKGTRIVPVHFDAAVGQGGTGFLTRTGAGDSADAALAKPIQSALSTFQRSNPSLGNLGPTDTQSNATINRASAAPATLIELGSMVAWEKQYGKNFTSTQKFDQLATSVANAIYTGGQFKAEPPKQQVRTLNMPGTDTSKQHLVVVAPSKPNIPGVSAEFVSMGNNQWKTTREYDNAALQIMMTKLRQ